MAKGDGEREQDIVDEDIVQALESFLNSKNVNRAIMSLLKDYTPGKKQVIDDQGNVRVQEEPARGFSFMTAFNATRMFVTNPRRTVRLIRFARKQNQYNTPAFQRRMLESEATWNFVSNVAYNIQDIGLMMQSFGVEEFNKGGILDQEALKLIGDSLRDPEVIKGFKAIALDSTSNNPNYLKSASVLLGLASKPGFKKYFNTRGEDIKNYIVFRLDQQANEPNSELNKQLQENGITINDLNSLLDIVPILLDSPEDLKQIVDLLEQGKYEDLAIAALDMVENNQAKYGGYMKQNSLVFAKIINKTMSKNEAFRKSGLQYAPGEDGPGEKGVQQIAVLLFDHPAELKSLISLQKEGRYIDAVHELMMLVNQDQNIQNYFANNTSKITKFIALSARQELMKDRIETRKENANWAKLNDIQKKQYLDRSPKWQGKTELEKELIIKEGLPEGIYKQAKRYGIVRKLDGDKIEDHLEAISEIIPILLSDPQHIGLMIDYLKEGNYADIAIYALERVDKNPKIQAYFDKNKVVFGNAIKATLKGNTAFQKSGLGAEIADIAPLLMNHPKELQEIIRLQEAGKYIDIGEKVLTLMGDDKIKDYFVKNSAGFKKFAVEMVKQHIEDDQRKVDAERAAFKKMTLLEKRQFLNTDPKYKELPEKEKAKILENGIPDGLDDQLDKFGLKRNDLDGLAEIIPILINKPDELATIMSQFKEGNYADIAITALSMPKDDNRINQYIKDNEQTFIKAIDKTMQQYPMFSDIKGDLIHIVPILMDHPENLIKMTELAKEGKFEKIGTEFFDLMQKDKRIGEYFKDNRETFQKVLVKAAGLDNYNISPELADVFVHLTNEKNVEMIRELTILAEKEDWMKLASEACRMIDEDPEFKAYLRSNEKNFRRLVKVALDQQPEMKAMLGGAKVGDLAAKMLQKPGDIRVLIEGVQGGKVAAVMAGAKFAYNVGMDAEMRAAMGKALGGWWYGKGDDNQAVVDAMLDVVNNRPAQKNEGQEKLRLSDFLEVAFTESIAENNPEQKKKILKQIVKKQLFENVKIHGDGNRSVNFRNMQMDGMHFLNSDLDKVSFDRSDLRNVSFHGVKFGDAVYFHETTMDKNTVASLLPAARKGEISLSGIKLVGEMKGLDLSGIDLKHADLSGVTDLEGAILTNANLESAKLPQDPKILANTYGLRSAKLPDGIKSDELMEAHSKFTVSKISEKIFEKFKPGKRPKRGAETLSPLEENALHTKINELYFDDSPIGERIREYIDQTPGELIGGQFPPIGNPKHVKDYKGHAKQVLTVIYRHARNPDKIERAIVADILADKVVENLFKEGSNRGQDGMLIRGGVIKAVDQFMMENKINDPKVLLEPKNFRALTDGLTREVSARTVSTTAGILTGGIQLSGDAIDKDFVEKAVGQMNMHVGADAFSKAEEQAIDKLAGKVASNVLGDYHATKSPAQSAEVHNTISKAIYEMKKEHNGIDMAEIISKNMDKIVGADLSSGLSKMYYEKTRLFRGFDKAIHGKEFHEGMKDHIEKEAGRSIQVAIGKKSTLLLSPDMKSKGQGQDWKVAKTKSQSLKKSQGKGRNM